MRMDKLTIKSQEALAEAQSICTTRGQSEIQPAHLLRALLEQGEGSTLPILQKLGVPIDRLQSDLEKQIAGIPKVTGGSQPQLSGKLSTVIQAGFAEADALKDEFVSTEHLLLGIATEKSDPAGRLLLEAGANRESILKALV
jgi:ATP-dependent Clp protease ATP-binding subunit ClpB